MKIKICGIKTFKVACHVALEKADFLGLVFVKGVRREITLDKGTAIVDSLKSSFENPPSVVGLFQNQSPSLIDLIVKKSRLDWVQLCGERDDSGSLSVPTIRQIRVKPEYSIHQIQDKVFEALNVHSMVILDSYDEEKPGGTGKVFDWNKILRLESFKNVLIAGGLNSNNVSAMISKVKPWGVDVSSGVETDGEKDLGKISNFITNVRNR